MVKHHEVAEGLSENIDEETQSYIFNQTMLRIKDPKISIDFCLSSSVVVVAAFFTCCPPLLG